MPHRGRQPRPTRNFGTVCAPRLHPARFLLPVIDRSIDRLTVQMQGGVSYTKGDVTILGGNFRDNVVAAEGEAKGGVLFGGTGAAISIAGGVFEGNEAEDGGVAYLFTGAKLTVEGGEFSGNVASNTGGGIAVVENAHLEVGTRTPGSASFGLELLSDSPS